MSNDLKSENEDMTCLSYDPIFQSQELDNMLKSDSPLESEPYVYDKLDILYDVFIDSSQRK